MNVNTGIIHVVTLICHTVVLVAIIIAVVILSGEKLLDFGTVTFLATLGGVTGSGLVINGRKVPQQGQRAEDMPPQ